ncbi:MAG: class I SAM-dependent methyltransferase [Wenzhouxiangella sp.]|jgi:ubiquinone/menaquinone biosynthesis C-methylase UbiE|nr:class I SAM-dependent methyltransferase [Wenzhouxiangella sp.]
MRGIEQIPWLYDLLMALAPGIERWRCALVAEADGRVLEVGCGTGRGLPDYAEGVELFALDLNFSSLYRAQRRRHEARLVCASVEAVPFADDSFDFVVSSLVFCSVPDADRGLSEIKRVLRPGGKLLMLEHVQARSRFWARVLDRIQPAWTTVTGGCHPNRDTVGTVERAGFVIDSDSFRERGLMRRFVARPQAGS